MAQCPECGSNTSPDHAFCLVCGSDLGRSASGGSDQETITPPAPAGGTGSGSPPSGQQGSRPASGGRAGREPARARGRRQESAAAVPALVALFGSIALQQAITSLVSPDAYLYRLFRPAGGWIMAVVPALIGFALIWTLTDLILKFRVARANERDLNRADVNQLPNLVAQEPTSTTIQRLRGWDAQMLARPVGRRIHWLLQHLDTVDAQRAHELIRHQSDLEVDSAASGYRTVKLLIWAMPILGFIGTVLGISLAVGGFSEFLTTNVSIDEIDRVTAELGNVASGLSFAFDTTLLGLLGGLVATVVSSGVQSRQERLLTRLDELGLRIMESAHPGDASVVARRPEAAGEEFDRMMSSRLDELTTQMDRFTRSVRTGLDGFLGEWSKLPPEVERVAADLAGLRGHLAAAAKSTDQLLLETRLLLEGLNEASTRMNGRLTASMSSVNQTVEGLGESLEGASASLAQGIAGLSERVTASEGHLRSGLATLQQTIERNQAQSAAAVASQTAADQAMQRLSASITELGERLAEYREAQAALAPVLGQLAGPLELRIMPAMSARPSTGVRSNDHG